LNTGRDYYGLGADALAAVKRGAEARILKLLEQHHPPRHREARSELHRLHLTSPDEVSAGDARREPHIVLDTARSAGLTTDRNVFHNQRAQTFGPGIDPRSDSRRSTADNQNVKRFVVPEVEMEAEQPRDLVRRGIGHDDVSPKNHRGLGPTD